MRHILLIILLLATTGLHIDGAWDSQVAQPGAIRVLVIHAASDQTSALHLEALLPDQVTALSTQIDRGGRCFAHGCNAVAGPGETVTMTETVQLAADMPSGVQTITIFVDDDQRRSAWTTTPLTVVPLHRIYLPL
jgi:hypothetical protein